MKKSIMRTAVAALALAWGAAVQAGSVNGLVYSEDAKNIRLGEWNSQWSAMKTYAEANDIPMVVLMVKPGCGNCASMESSIAAASAKGGSFDKWVTTGFGKDLLLAITIDNTTPGGHSAQFDFFKIDGTYAFVGVYWPNHKLSGSSSSKAWVQKKTSESSLRSYAEEKLKGYVPGLTFPVSPTDGNRYEAEAGTEQVAVDIARVKADEKLTIVYSIEKNGTKVLSGQSVTLEAGETTGQIVVPQKVFADNAAKDGDTFSVVLDSGRRMDIAYRGSADGDPANDKYNTSANPLWIGERRDPSKKGIKPELDYGEWTMDFDVATNMVANKGGYTLVSVQGSLWCPDCANTDRNFLDLEEDGVNLFKAWAAKHNVALVTLDIPNYTNALGDCATPCLLSRKAFATALARDTYVDKKDNVYKSPTKSQIKNKKLTAVETPELTGADPALVEATLRSGLGYLTRKNVDDDTASFYFKRNHELAYRFTADGGFHRPEDGNANRPGVPIFVLLRRDGTVAGRFTKFASRSPFLADRESFLQYIARLEELMVDADDKDPSEIENNDARSTALRLASDGKSKAAFVSHADAVDVYRLSDAAADVRLVVGVKANDDLDGQVTVEIQSQTNSCKPVVLAAATGSLKDNVWVNYVFTEADSNCFVAVKAVTGDASFAAESKARTRIGYTVESSMVLVPTEKGGEAEVKYDTIGIAVEANKYYRLANVGEKKGELEKVDAANGIFLALTSGVVDIPVTDTSVPVSFQVWRPGEIGFNYQEKKRVGTTTKWVVVDERTVKETVGEVEIPIARQNGSSGAVTVSATLNRAKSTNIVIHDEACNTDWYRWDNGKLPADTPIDFSWESGSEGETNLVISIVNDDRYDGDCTFAFDLTLKSGVTELVHTNFYLHVTEDDKSRAGKVRFEECAPFYLAKSSTIYARTNETGLAEADVYLGRYDGCDAVVSGALKTVNCAVDTSAFSWDYHCEAPQVIHVSGIELGKTAKVSLTGLKGGLKAGTPSSVSIIAVDAAAPKFEQDAYAETAYRYVAVSNAYKVVQRVELADVPAEKITKRTLSFSKLSGSLPSGLSASWDKADSLVVKGIPSKAGSFVAYYQVTETVSYKNEKNRAASKKVTGFVTRLAITVLDPAQEGSGPDGKGVLNDSCAVSRTFTDLMVVGGDGRLAGTLTLTIPKLTGKVSAKYNCSTGAVTFSSAKSWSALDTNDRNALVVELVGSSSKYRDYRLTVRAFNDDSIAVEVADPTYPGTPLEVTHDGKSFWSKTSSAAKYKGTYTVSLPTEAVLHKDRPDFASTGTGYLTLKMTSSTAWNAGKVTWGLMLPNGKTASGSAVLTPGDGVRWPRQFTDCNSQPHFVAYLPIVYRTSTDFFSGVLMIAEDAAALAAAADPYRAVIFSASGVDFRWRHSETAAEAKAGYETVLGAYGAILDVSNLSGCCLDAHETTDYDFMVTNLETLVSFKYGPFDPEGEVMNPLVRLNVEGSKITKDLSVYGNDQKVTLTLTKSTGIVTGSFNLPYLTASGTRKNLSVSYRGIVLSGWGEGCGCGTQGWKQAPDNRPLVNGTWYFTDTVKYKHEYISRGKTLTSEKSVSVKRGGAVWAEPVITGTKDAD